MTDLTKRKKKRKLVVEDPEAQSNVVEKKVKEKTEKKVPQFTKLDKKSNVAVVQKTSDEPPVKKVKSKNKFKNSEQANGEAPQAKAAAPTPPPTKKAKMSKDVAVEKTPASTVTKKAKSKNKFKNPELASALAARTSGVSPPAKVVVDAPPPPKKKAKLSEGVAVEKKPASTTAPAKKKDAKATSTTETSEEGKGKKKRPWRDRVRKVAAKKTAQLDRAESGEKAGAKEGDEGKKKKKKNKGKKKKFLKAKEGEAVEEEDDEEVDPKEAEKQEALARLQSGRFRYLNEQLYTTTSEEAVMLFAEDPSAFTAYHEGFAAQTKKWPNHPLRTIIQWLHRKPAGQVILDLGCGEAKIAAAVGEKHDVKSFDLVAVNERVTACDMAHLPVEDESADIVIFCLSLMGTNLADFIREARRVLKTDGTLKIAEVTSRFTKTRLFADAIAKLGFKVVERKSLTEYFTMMEFTKTGKVENKRPFGLVLKPCLYKKR